MSLNRSSSAGDKTVDLEKDHGSAAVRDAQASFDGTSTGVSHTDDKKILRKIGASLLAVLLVVVLEARAGTDGLLSPRADLHIMPLMCAVYLIQFLDKTSLSYAAIMGIREDNKLSLSQYSWLSSIF